MAVDLQGGVVVVHRPECLGQQDRRQRQQAGNRQRPPESICQLTRRLLKIFRLRQQSFCRAEQLATYRGHRQATGLMANEQLCVERIFQLRNGGRHGRLRNMHFS